MKYFFICLFLFCVPLFSHAAVIINEVAWMGTHVSANDEWIELYNNGSQSVDVTGWTLTDGVNLNIVVTGSIAAGQYAVLERTDDQSAPGPMFMQYVGALANTGATLSLYRADDALEDRVVGGEAWVHIGGDNATKETAQYTVGGWITAEATAGSRNAQEETIDPEVIDEDDSGSQADEEKEENSNTASEITLYLTPRTLHSSIDAPARVYVNQEVSMHALTSGLSESLLHSLHHQWNYGDFSIGTGAETKHRFTYPGEYVLTLHSVYGEYEAYARKTILVLPVSFSMTKNAAGDIQVHNDARYEIDLSGYTVAAGKTLLFPPLTILLPNATITIPKEKLQYSHNRTVTLSDDAAVLVASVSPDGAVVQLAPIPVEQKRVSVPVVHSPITQTKTRDENFSFVGEEKKTVETGIIPQATTSEAHVSQMAAPIQAAREIPEDKLPYFALLAVIGLGVTAVFAGKVSK